MKCLPKFFPLWVVVRFRAVFEGSNLSSTVLDRMERDVASCMPWCLGTMLGSASEGAKGWGAVWGDSGHAAQYYDDMLPARLGMGEGERANTSAGAWKQSLGCHGYIQDAQPPRCRPCAWYWKPKGCLNAEDSRSRQASERISR